MRYKRKEGFRYSFKQPLEATLNIVKINEKAVKSNQGKAYIYDLSPGGLKIETEFDLQFQKNQIDIQISFELATSHELNGTIVWQDKNYLSGYYYGVDLIITEEKSNQIIDELKSFIQQEKSNK